MTRKFNSVIKDIIKNSTHSITGIFEKCVQDSKHNTEQLTSHQDALNKVLQHCREEVNKCKSRRAMPSPKYFEHAAMLSRQAKNYENEIAICELYIGLVNDYVSKRTFSKKKIERKVHTLCEPLVMRMQNAKNLSKNNGNKLFEI